jgi:hypothetical protein
MDNSTLSSDDDDIFYNRHRPDVILDDSIYNQMYYMGSQFISVLFIFKLLQKMSDNIYVLN